MEEKLSLNGVKMKNNKMMMKKNNQKSKIIKNKK